MGEIVIYFNYNLTISKFIFLKLLNLDNICVRQTYKK